MRCLELFAGAGGAALGLDAAGFSHALMVEKDPDACSTLRAAGFCSVYEGDVTDIDGIIAAERATWRTEEQVWQISGDALIDVNVPSEDEDSDAWPLAREALALRLLESSRTVHAVWASPPCPLHSRANSRRRAEAFDGWPATLAVIAHFMPSIVMVENVQAAASVAVGWAQSLRYMGYHVAHAVLDAADYGTPQTRRRLILVGRLGGPVALPVPTHGPMRGLPHVAIGDALPHLRGEVASALPQDSGGLHRAPCGEVVYPSSCGRAASEPWRLDRPAPTVMTTEVKGTRASKSSGWTFNGGPDRLADALFLATGRRRAIVEECAVAQGFPVAWPFRGTKTAKYRQVGNAVPPALAEAVGRAAIGLCRT